MRRQTAAIRLPGLRRRPQRPDLSPQARLRPAHIPGINPCSWRKTWVHRPAAQPGPHRTCVSTAASLPERGTPGDGSPAGGVVEIDEVPGLIRPTDLRSRGCSQPFCGEIRGRPWWCPSGGNRPSSSPAGRRKSCRAKPGIPHPSHVQGHQGPPPPFPAMQLQLLAAAMALSTRMVRTVCRGLNSGGLLAGLADYPPYAFLWG